MAGTVVVARARDEVEAAIWVDALREAGIRAAMFEQGVSAALGGASVPGWASYPVVVARADIGRARNVIAEFAGAAALAPISDGASGERLRRAALAVAGAIAAIVMWGLAAKLFA